MSHPLRLTHFASFPSFSLHRKPLLSFPWISEYHPRCSCFLPFTHLTIHSRSGFPSGSAGKESTCSVRDLGSIPGFGKSPGERKGYPLQCSGLEKSVDCIVHRIAKSQTQLRNFHFFSKCNSQHMLPVM